MFTKEMKDIRTASHSSRAVKKQDQQVARRHLLLGGISLPSAAALLATCSKDMAKESGKDKEHIKISFVGAVLNNPFWDQVKRGALAAADSLAGVELIYVAPDDFSLANINEIIKTVIASSPDGIAIDYRGQEFERVTQQALDQGMEVQFFNNFKGLDSEDPRIERLAESAVGLDKYEAARRSGEAFLEFLNPNDPIVLFNGLPDTYEHLLIQNAYLRFFSEVGWERKHVQTFPVGLDSAQNFQLMKSYLAAHPEVRGIICWDSLVGSPAARAKVDSGLDIPILSWNLDPIIIQSIKDGSLTLTLSQQPYVQAYYTVVALYLKLKYRLIQPPSVDPGVFLISRSNLLEAEKLFLKGILG